MVDPVVKKIDGTSAKEFYIGKGDIAVAGQDIVGFRVNPTTKKVDYRIAGDIWRPLNNQETLDLITGLAFPTYLKGRLFYDDSNECLAYFNENNQMSLCLGREFCFRVYNDSGSAISNGTPCYIDNAASGMPTVDLLDPTDYFKSRLIGVSTVDIPDSDYGYVTYLGDVNDLDTSPWPVGTILYGDPSTPGGYTSTIPTGGNFVVRIGIVTISNATTGRITMAPFSNEYTAETVSKTGWPGLNSVSLSFSNATRTLSLDPFGGASDFYFYQAGIKYTKTNDSIVLPDTEGLFFVYYNEGTLAYLLDPSFAQIDVAIRNNPLVTYLYWNAADEQWEYFGNETHGFIMDSDTHSYLHWTNGAQYITGLGLTDILTDQSGDVDTHAQFGVESGVITDEDRVSFPITFASTAGLDCYYLTGSESNPSLRSDTTSGFSVINTGTGRLAYNQLTGGNWQLTEVTNNDFVMIHVFANNSVDSGRRTFAILGQNEYPNAGQARAGAETEIRSIITSGLVGPEIVPIATVIFQTSNGYDNAVQARIRSTDLGDDYIDWRESELLGGGGSSGVINPVFADDQFKIIENTDNTKEMQFQLSGLTTGTTRVMTVPDNDGTLLTTGNQSDVDHTQISNVGTNTHAQIDSHISSTANPHQVSLEQARSQSNVIDGDIDANGNTVTGLGTPSAGSDATSKDYVDGLIQGVSWHDPVIARQSTPPGSPVLGDRYIVIATATGDWAGQEDDIAEWDGAAWIFDTPEEGWAVYVQDEDGQYVFNGTSWVPFGSTVNHQNLSNLQGGNSTERYHLTSAQHGSLTGGGDSTDHYHSSDRNRANHTGTQTKSTISDFQHALDSATDHSAPSDNTNFDATTSAHGLLPKLSGQANEHLNGVGDWVETPTRRVSIQYALTEQVQNTQKYFYAYRRGLGDSYRSGNNGGIQNSDSCSPGQVPFDATIVGAVLTVKGVGVQNSTVTYPVTYRAELNKQNAGTNWGTPSDLGDIDFSISDSFTVGTFSAGNTLFVGNAGALDIDVDEGDMLSLEFINGSGASNAAMSTQAYITLILEERTS